MQAWFDDKTNNVKIKFAYNPRMIRQIKSIRGGRWNSIEKVWIVPFNKYTIDQLIQWGIALDTALKSKVKSLKKDISKQSSIKKSYQDHKAIIPYIKNKLPKSILEKLLNFPYQIEGVAFIESRNGRALNADQMRLGKTVQSLAWLSIHPEINTVIIICPTTVKLKWKEEVQTWLSKRAKVLYGKSSNIKLLRGVIYIINYDIVVNWIELLKELNPDCIIIDESHKIKTKGKIKKGKTGKITKFKGVQKTGAIIHLSKGIKHIIALSGTPILNRPIEIFNICSIIDSTIFPSRFAFGIHYCDGKNNGYGWNFNGASNTDELYKVLTSTIMIRRLKKDVIKQLPPVTRTFIPFEIENRVEYTKAETNLIQWLKSIGETKKALKASRAEGLVLMSVLKKLALEGKINQVIEWVEDFLEIEEKLVVFTSHTFTIDKLLERFKDISVRIDGSTSMKNRKLAEEQFQTNKDIKLFIGNIKAASEGITLSVADNVAIAEPPSDWSPGTLSQAESRIEKIGLEIGNLNTHYLWAQNTIEDVMYSVVSKKDKIIGASLDGISEDADNSYMKLIKYFRNIAEKRKEL